MRLFLPPPLLSAFGDFGDPDDPGFDDPAFGDFGDPGDPVFDDPAFGDFGDPGDPGFDDFAHSSASLASFCFVNAVFADPVFADGFCKSITGYVLRPVTLSIRDFWGRRIRYILSGGINRLIKCPSNPRILAISNCLSVFNMLQSHKFAVPSTRPVAKNLPLG